MAVFLQKIAKGSKGDEGGAMADETQ